MIPADVEIIGRIRWIYWGSASKSRNPEFWKIQRGRR